MADPKPDRLRIAVDGGKYTVVQDDQGRTSALRHGEPWLGHGSDKPMLGTTIGARDGE